MFLIKDVPESKAEQSDSSKFDYAGLVVFILVMVALNVFITRGADFGWTSPISLTLMAVTVIGGWLFLKHVTSRANGFIDISLFKNKYFTGATVSNFLLNGVALEHLLLQIRMFKWQEVSVLSNLGYYQLVI